MVYGSYKCSLGNITQVEFMTSWCKDNLEETKSSRISNFLEKENFPQLKPLFNSQIERLEPGEVLSVSLTKFCCLLKPYFGIEPTIS